MATATTYFTLDEEPRATLDEEPRVTLDEEPRAVWDIITNENKTYYLNGPSSVTLEDYKNLILPLISETVLENGRMETSTYKAWIPGPFCERRGQHTVGVFVKIYNGDGENAWRGIREYETMGYLGQQTSLMPNVITVRNYPSPTMLFQGRLLVLPLILTTKNIKSFCQKKRDFYLKNFGVAPDLSMVLGKGSPSSHGNSPFVGVHSSASNRAKFCRLFENFLVDNHLQRKLLREAAFVHGDSLSCNVLKENARSLHHRLTGEWPSTKDVGWKFRGKDGSYVTVLLKELSVFVDYDTVCFPSEVEYPISVEEYFTETVSVLQTFYCYDRVHDYVCLLKEQVIPLARKVAVQEVAGGRFRKCCEAVFKKTERFFTPYDGWREPEKNFHDIHSSFQENEDDQDYAYYMMAIKERITELVVYFQRVMDVSFEDEYTISRELRSLLQEEEFYINGDCESNVVIINCKA